MTRPAKQASDPDSEVREQVTYRAFSVEYKRDILRQVAACTVSGEVGALLRREGLYSSHVSKWRRQLSKSAVETPAKRGRKPADPVDRRVVELERENARLKRKLEKAETIIDVQKKLCQLLNLEPASEES